MSQPNLIVAVPPSTPERLVFPLKSTNQEYDTSFYNPTFTHNRAGIEEINQIAAEIRNSRKPFASRLASANCWYIFFIFSTLFVMVGLNFLFLDLFDPIVALAGFLLYLIVIVTSSSILRSRLLRITAESKAAAQFILDRHAASFTARGLRWVLPAHFPMWIELHKDYLLNQNVAGQPVYLPPNMYQQPNLVYPAHGQFNPQFQNPQIYNPYQGGHYQNQQNNGGAYNV